MSEAKWYILHTYSGYENKVAGNIMKVVENNNLHHLIEEVMVPTETVVEEHDGKTKTYESKLFPSYVYVKMILTDESWYICRNTRGCTGFVGRRIKAYTADRRRGKEPRRYDKGRRDFICSRRYDKDCIRFS